MPLLIPSRPGRILLLIFAVMALPAFCRGQDNSNGRQARRTQLVRAIEKVRPSVVNIRGRKTVHPDQQIAQSSDPIKQVNGMGTGIVIDPRGFILTNYHVVQDVRQIQVVTHDRKTATGRLVAHDEQTDLAILKVDFSQSLPVAPLGTSSDLMLAETVAAIGNAYGYSDTVTRGIVSALGRTVQVSDDQTYYNLIQVDVPINPGNSGGPLVNINGDVIGVNVAVRVGAQNIAFAIPVNDALEVVSNMLSGVVGQSIYTGMHLNTKWENDKPEVVVKRISDQSAAARSGLNAGDQIETIQGQPCLRSSDFYRHLIGRMPKDEIKLGIRRNGEFQSIAFKLDYARNRNLDDPAWKLLGLQVVPVGPKVLNRISEKYSHGLRVVSVREGSPAESEGIQSGDVLVAIHKWRTESVDNLDFIMQRPEVTKGNYFRFFILRGANPLWGQIRVAAKPR